MFDRKGYFLTAKNEKKEPQRTQEPFFACFAKNSAFFSVKHYPKYFLTSIKETTISTSSNTMAK